MNWKTLCQIFIFSLLSGFLLSQEDLRVREWKSYLPFRTGYAVTQSENAVYYGSEWAVMKVNKEDLSLEFISKVDGLNDVEVRLVKYYEAGRALLVIYKNSNIDLVTEDFIINFNDIKTNNQIIGDKQIYDIHIRDGIAYLATGFGLVQLNLESLEFGATTIVPIPINGVTTFEDDLYISTDLGIYRISNSGSEVVQDFNIWNRLSENEGLPGEYVSNMLTVADGELYAGIDNMLFRLKGGQTEFEFLFSESSHYPEYLVESDRGLISGWSCANGCNDKKYILEPGGSKIDLKANCVWGSTDAVVDQQNRIWFADINLDFKYFSLDEDQCKAFKTNSPPNNNVSDLAVYDGALYVAAGGVTPIFGYLFREDGFYTNEDGNWTSYNKRNVEILKERDMRDILVVESGEDGTIYFGTFWDGLLAYKEGSFQLFDATNSSLQFSVVNPDRNRITGLSFDQEDNLWVINHNAPHPVSRYSKDGEWMNFTIPTSTNTEKLVVDQFNNLWIAIGGVGLLVINYNDINNTADDQYRIFNSNNSALTTNSINALAEDKDGNMWVGTPQGPVLFNCADFVFDDICAGTRLIVSQNGIAGELLGGENIRTIAIDGGNRKWFGTSNGVFVQSPDAETQIHAFNIDNSPLFDNTIIDIEINPESGEVIIATNKGIISYRGDATEGSRFHDSPVIAFPNPVRPPYQGPISIRGLATDSEIHITDISGNLVYKTKSTGGQVVWDGKDLNGAMVNSGVYLIFSAKTFSFQSPDAAVGKIMIVR